MCGLFGFSDLQHSLTEKQASALANSLARASAVRGQDATGIAYVQSGKLRIYKRPKPAARMQLRLPKGTTQLLGHVRMTTQGSEKKNYNNHPFRGALPGGDFALAHNGVLHNETGIRLRFNLPQTAVETDSFVTVQLLQSYGAVTPQTIAAMAEQLEGTFTFSILTSGNDLYLVRGNNPLSVWYYPATGVHLYASTPEILAAAVIPLPYLRGKVHQTVKVAEGEILCITAEGKMHRSHFSTERIDYMRFWQSLCWPYKKDARKQRRDLTVTAHNMGFDPADVDWLSDCGYGEEEIEAALNDSDAFRALLSDACYEMLYY